MCICSVITTCRLYQRVDRPGKVELLSYRLAVQQGAPANTIKKLHFVHKLIHLVITSLFAFATYYHCVFL